MSDKDLTIIEVTPTKPVEETRDWRWWDDVEKLTKLKFAYGIGADDKKACHFAGITARQLYYYQEKVPEFVIEKQTLKEAPILKALQTIKNNLSEVETAKWYLERKLKAEFGNKATLDINNYNPAREILLRAGLIKNDTERDDF